MVLLLSTSCAKVKIKDSIWMGSLGESGAAEFHTLKTDKRLIDRRDWDRMWDDLSHPIICTYADTFADWKSIIEKLCSFAPGKCSYEDKQKLALFFHKTQRYKAEFSGVE